MAIFDILAIVGDVNPASVRHGDRFLEFLPGRRLGQPPVQISDQAHRRGPRKDVQLATGVRHRDQHREDFPSLYRVQMMAHVPVQDGGVAYLQLGAVVVRWHAGVPEKGERVGGDISQLDPELVALRVGRSYIQDGPLQGGALGDVGRLPALDGPVQGEQPAVIGYVGSAVPDGVLFGLAQ